MGRSSSSPFLLAAAAPPLPVLPGTLLRFDPPRQCVNLAGREVFYSTSDVDDALNLLAGAHNSDVLRFPGDVQCALFAYSFIATAGAHGHQPAPLIPLIPVAVHSAWNTWAC